MSGIQGSVNETQSGSGINKMKVSKKFEIKPVSGLSENDDNREQT